MITFPFNGVEGLLSDSDKESLKAFAERCADVLGDYFEIGSLRGLSSLCICSGMPQGKNLHCFDFFEPDKFGDFMVNVVMANCQNRVRIYMGDFRHAVFSNQPFAFGFVDHDHKLNTTIAAYEKFWPLLSPGGILAFHDFGHAVYPEPFDFLNTLPHRISLQETIIAFQKPK